MSDIVLLDTSIYLNVLDVVGLNETRDKVLDTFQIRISEGDYFLLPLATVWETGNHIANLRDGQLRRKYSESLWRDIEKAFNGKVPYRATHFPERDEFLTWLREFPDIAMRNKAAARPGEGISLADFSIVKEWERNCSLHPLSRVRIWSIDSDLSAYDRAP